MRLYLAARMSRLPELARYRKELEGMGYEVTSRWLNNEEDGLTFADIADLDLDDVRRADAIVLFTQEAGSANVGGNRLIEFGYAWALGKDLNIVGEKELVFLHHPRVRHHETWEEFRDWAARQ